ncbi:MAG: RNA methyltransferase [Prolixibacteraceae bacterium]|jgi:tRNA (guanosine-2'-O-)-methyltransferase|nr:RNA methyltransferase [Prolixibacteraceae bacterium]
MEKEVIRYLSQYLTKSRWSLLQKVIKNRTKFITIVLEDIYQSQNASAVLRTCDCYGIQNVHVIENRNEFDVNPQVALGASKWLNINHYNSNENNTCEALDKLKSDGYRIIATSPHENDVSLEDFDFGKGKFALVFGTERQGISEEVKKNADEFLKIPMFGFTESFNISVSAAIILHHLTHKIRNSETDWKLTEKEQDKLIISWLKKSIKGSETIVNNFMKTK